MQHEGSSIVTPLGPKPVPLSSSLSLPSQKPQNSDAGSSLISTAVPLSPATAASNQPSSPRSREATAFGSLGIGTGSVGVGPRPRLGTLGSNLGISGNSGGGRLGSLKDGTVPVVGSGNSTGMVGNPNTGGGLLRQGLNHSPAGPPPPPVLVGAALKAAAAKARVPSPDPAPRKLKTKMVSWAQDENLVGLRWFKKV